MRVNSLFYFTLFLAGDMLQDYILNFHSWLYGLNMKCTPDHSAALGGCGIFSRGDLGDENRSPGVSLKA